MFSERFPLLKEKLSDVIQSVTEKDGTSSSIWEIKPSRSGEPTASENGLLLHSSYNPVQEAKRAAETAEDKNIHCAAFFSMGLGYFPIEWAKKNPSDTILIAEPSARHFFEALKFNDFEPLFKHEKLILALQAGIEEVCPLIEKQGFSETKIFENNAQTLHAKDYFSALNALIKRNKEKVRLNTATLEKFSSRWLKNTCKNAGRLFECDGVNIYKDKCPENLPFLILSAGPTLAEVLPHLSELKKRAVLVAVDTALQACLRQKVEPDFIVLTDPQYYAWRHIAGKKSPSSVLITESAAYPPVFRFECKKKVLFSSLFPLGKFIESKTHSKGILGTGGSVSTTAWDFARYSGAERIYCAGLDLGFPKSQTHIKGSQFEEEAHRLSTRIKPAETILAAPVSEKNALTGCDYSGNEILTDSKMKMFAWWFESRTQEFPETKSFSLSTSSLFIPGFSAATAEELLKEEEKTELKKEFFSSAEKEEKSAPKEAFDSALRELKSGLFELENLAKEGIRLCEEGLKNADKKDFDLNEVLKKLSGIDKKIMLSDCNETAALVFPTESKLNGLFAKIPRTADAREETLLKSKIIYTELLRAAQTCLFYL